MAARVIEKWTTTTRFHRFRAAWVPEHLRERVYYYRGTREEMAAIAARLEKFADAERDAHPNRRAS